MLIISTHFSVRTKLFGKIIFRLPSMMDDSKLENILSAKTSDRERYLRLVFALLEMPRLEFTALSRLSDKSLMNIGLKALSAQQLSKRYFEIRKTNAEYSFFNAFMSIQRERIDKRKEEIKKIANSISSFKYDLGNEAMQKAMQGFQNIIGQGDLFASSLSEIIKQKSAVEELVNSCSKESIAAAVNAKYTEAINQQLPYTKLVDDINRDLLSESFRSIADQINIQKTAATEILSTSGSVKAISEIEGLKGKMFSSGGMARNLGQFESIAQIAAYDHKIAELVMPRLEAIYSQLNNQQMKQLQEFDRSRYIYLSQINNITEIIEGLPQANARKIPGKSPTSKGQIRGIKALRKYINGFNQLEIKERYQFYLLLVHIERWLALDLPKVLASREYAEASQGALLIFLHVILSFAILKESRKLNQQKLKTEEK